MPISLGIGTAVTRGGGLYGPSPQLDLNFASLLSLTPSVGPTPSYTRASTGTYFNASGVLTTAAINGPRFDHVYNGSSWVSKGLLIEEARTNNSQYSEDLTNAYWTKYQTSILSNSAAALDGNQTADKLVENSLNDQHSIFNSGFATTAGTAYTISFFAKSAGRNFIQFMSATSLSGAGARANFDLQSGVLGTVSGTNTTAEIVNVGNGWYRCVTKISSALATGTAYLQFATVSTATATAGEAYLGDGSSGVLIWGIQLESGGGFATSYIPTTTAPLTRSADVCQITGGDFSGFYNQSEGSFAVEYRRNSLPPVTSFTFEAYNDTLNKINNEQDNTGVEYFGVRVSAVDQVSLATTGLAAGNTSKFAFAYKVNDFAASLNGASVLTDNAGTVPTVNSLSIGNRGAYGSIYPINGHIARLRYFNTRLINSQLVALST